MWLTTGDHPTIADSACFPYTALVHEGNFSIAEYPAVVAWCDRAKSALCLDHDCVIDSRRACTA
jgi:glutathione S-transferase